MRNVLFVISHFRQPFLVVLYCQRKRTNETVFYRFHKTYLLKKAQLLIIVSRVIYDRCFDLIFKDQCMF